MKEINIAGAKVTVHGLTRGALKRLRAEGINLETILEIEDDDKKDAAIDKVLAMACTGAEADAITPGQATDIILAIAEETFMPEAARKNLQTPPANGSPDGITTAEPAETQMD